MNYRHQFHAGNFADVVKHALLVRLVRAMQQKEKGFVFLDTHAGRGSYDLQAAAVGDSLARTPEWPDGIGRLLPKTDVPSTVADYIALVREFDRRRGNLQPGLRFYPGSPWLARMLARSQDRLVLCERHPAEFAALQVDVEKPAATPGARTIVQMTDGYAAIKAILPPPERRSLVLVDPPFEMESEFAQISAALADGLDRLKGGVFALWYPLTERARVQEFLAAIESAIRQPTLVLELSITGPDSTRKMKGCGLVVVNPPWRFDTEAVPILEYLAGVLSQEAGSGGRASWLIPES